MASRDIRQAFLLVYDAITQGIRVNVVKTVASGGGGGSGGPFFGSGADIFIATGNGIIVDVSTSPVKSFGLQVKKTGTVTSWTVVLEGSLDGVEFSTILTHTSASNSDGSMMWSGQVDSPCLYFRSRCSAISLGGGTNVIATILGLS